MALTTSSSGASLPSSSDMSESSGTSISRGNGNAPVNHNALVARNDNNTTNFSSSSSSASGSSGGFDWKFWGTIGGTALAAVLATIYISRAFKKKRRSGDDDRRTSDITSASEMSEVSESDFDDRRRRRAKDRKAKRQRERERVAQAAIAAAQSAYRSDHSENGSRATQASGHHGHGHGVPPDDRRGSIRSIESAQPMRAGDGKQRPNVPDDDEPISPMSLSSSLNSRSGLDNPERSSSGRSPVATGTNTPSNSAASRHGHGHGSGHGSLSGSGNGSGVLVNSAHGAHGYQHAPMAMATPGATLAHARSLLYPDEGVLIERLIHSRTRLEQQGTQSTYGADIHNQHGHGHDIARYSESREVKELLEIIHTMDLRRCGVRLRQKAAEWLMTLKALAGAQARDDEEFKRVIRDSKEMWRAWEILDYPVEDEQQQTAFDMLRVDVALRMHDHYRMAPIFDRLTAKGVGALSYEALQVTFAYAPVLGRWSLTRQLGDQIKEAAPGRMQELHNNAAQSSEVPDFMMLYELAEEEARHGDWPLEAMGWDRYSVIGLHLKLRHVSPEEPMDERFAVFRSGEWIHTQFEKAELHRMGAFALLIPADGGQLVGPANQQRMRLAGVRDLDNGCTVREDYDLQKAAEAGAWIGTYTFLQTDIHPTNGEVTSVKVTFEVALQLVLTLSFEHPATGPVVASTSPPPPGINNTTGGGGRTLPSSSSSAATARTSPPMLTSSPPQLSSSIASMGSGSDHDNSGVLVAPIARYHQHHQQQSSPAVPPSSAPSSSSSSSRGFGPAAQHTAAMSSTTTASHVRSISPTFASGNGARAPTAATVPSSSSSSSSSHMGMGRH